MCHEATVIVDGKVKAHASGEVGCSDVRDAVVEGIGPAEVFADVTIWSSVVFGHDALC